MGGLWFDRKGNVTVLSDVWRFDPITNTTTRAADMPQPRDGFEAVVVNGTLIVVCSPSSLLANGVRRRRADVWRRERRGARHSMGGHVRHVRRAHSVNVRVRLLKNVEV